MQMRYDAVRTIGRNQSTVDSRKDMHHGSPGGRLLVALLMGFVLLMLSALIHAAAAATFGGGWSSLGAIWLVALVAIVLVVFGARTSVAAWQRMCFIDGLASLGLFAIGTPDLIGQGTPPLVQPFGPVLGVAIASGMLAIAGLLLALLLFAAWYLLSQRNKPGSDQHA